MTYTLTRSDKLFCIEGIRGRRKWEVNTDVSRFCRFMICIYRSNLHLHTSAKRKHQTASCEQFVNFESSLCHIYHLRYLRLTYFLHSYWILNFDVMEHTFWYCDWKHFILSIEKAKYPEISKTFRKMHCDMLDFVT